MSGMGKLLILLGGLMAVLGLVLLLADRIPWLGRLPGDIFIKRENFSFYFPLATCILLSLLLSLIVHFFRK
ncbi:MAG: DUF2905 domain-containing protein [Geobacteraceae bacterium]|nr:DUF2905 domain-containing protein [Geobacteraceae bacterium]